LVEYSDKKNLEQMAAILKMAADKIGTISMFSDFNENRYIRLYWSKELIGNDENCIRMTAIFKMDADKSAKFQCS
jgi:hypothetical protein